MWKIAYPVTRLVARHQGTLPVILTCPHDGDDKPAGVPERTSPSAKKERDLQTGTITAGVAQSLLEVFGEAPYVVIAEFHRKYIDANRAPASAYEDPDAKQYYDEYHNTIRGFVDQIRFQNGGLGLLFDIHGTAGITEDPADLYLGTSNGQNNARLLSIDPEAMWRRRSLRGFMIDAGHIVSPKQKGIPETSALNGGYTVDTYGSSNANGLDAIQIEIARPLRDDDGKRNALIQHLAYAIWRLVDQWADTHTLSAIQSLHLFGKTEETKEVAI